MILIKWFYKVLQNNIFTVHEFNLFCDKFIARQKKHGGSLIYNYFKISLNNKETK